MIVEMLNMLNQFYSYLTEKLFTYFDDLNLKGGERYYLQFDSKDQVSGFYNYMKENSLSQEFYYQHSHGSPYTTYALLVGDIKIVVAATNEKVTPDFLVTLRNQVGEQKNEWDKTALLSICHETLDSIRGGSSDLQKEGMPLNVKTILKTLEEEIEKNTTLTPDHKEILKFHLKKKKEDAFIQSSLWDYEEILGFLSQGEIKNEDFSHLGLFIDSNLGQIPKKQMQNRLEENYLLYQQVQHIHEYENLQNQLEKMFDDRGITLLKQKDWQENEFSAIRNSHENILQGDRPLEYKESNGKSTNEGLYFWERPITETKAGQRKRQIIIFNPQKREEIQLSFEFDDRLKKEYIHTKSEKYCTVAGKKLQVVLPHEKDSSSFYQIVYTHKNQAKSKYTFNITIVECFQSALEGIKTNYEVNPKMKQIQVNRKSDDVIFGSSELPFEEVLIDNERQIVDITDIRKQISNESPAWEGESLSIQLQINNSILPINIKEEMSKVTPISGMRVWKLKREHAENFNYDIEKNKLKQNTREFSANSTLKQYLIEEFNWVRNKFYFAVRTAATIEEKDMKLHPEVKAAYEELLEYYSSNNTTPSLAHLSDEIVVLSTKYIEVFIKAIAEIKEDSIMEDETKNLFRLGTIQEDEKILFTPFHPLNIAYQLEVQNLLEDEIVDLHILDRLSPNNLLPYIYGDKGHIYRPISQKDSPGWIMYEPIEKVSIGESNAFLSNVVEEKLIQFVEHFPFLFLHQAKSPLQINVINITNDKEVVRGLIKFLKKELEKKGVSSIVPIEVSIYNKHTSFSAFESFSLIEDVEELENEFDVSLKTNTLDAVDVLRIIRTNILYYRRLEDEEYGYAHISFFKMLSNDIPATNKMEVINTGISMKGLLSSQSYLKTKYDYRKGFGLKNAENQTNPLILVARSYNELASNLESDGVKPYHKGETIVTRTANYDEEILQQLYNTSYWVTFIEPSVDLNFFQDSSKNLIVIHYSDQYSSSMQYDAITVTDKSTQYKMIIDQHLKSNGIEAKQSEIETAIRAFNSFNGEWLLRLIGSKGHFSREKLSIISAIKYVLSIMDHPDIFWVPISLEEILRIAGATRLAKSEGIFSAKNLGVNGVHSDDLLLIGLEFKEDELFLHYFPVEVKLGLNQSNAIQKAKEQINKTHDLIKTQLSQDEEHPSFKNEFFRNFFIQIMLSNTEKLIENKIWETKDYRNIYKVSERLLNGEYKIGNHLNPFIGIGAVLSFKKDQSWKSINQEENILLVDLTEEDGYNGVITEIEQLKNNIQTGKTDINPLTLLTNKYQLKRDSSPQRAIEDFTVNQLAAENVGEYLLDNEKKKNNQDVINQDIFHEEKLEHEKVRVLLGTVEGSKKDIYWEYGNTGLANRHLLISGKSGQGKSYFIQCLLLELSRQGVSNIIFDYTDGFKNSKLETKFKELMGDNLEQFIVALDKFPINPFKRNKKELDDDLYKDEEDTDIAERIKGVFSSVFKDLGIQQQNAIYEAVLRGLKKFGDSMSLELLIAELEDDNSGPAKTARSQIKPLIDKNPFSSAENYNWQHLINQKGKVFIIQLTSYNRDVQMMITEFILWDLWNHLLNHGDKERPLTVVLDEAQNLDHREKSPSAKILTEGRKFGWSGCYATQSFKGQFGVDEVSRLQGASQKVYFMPPENEISSIAANLSQDSHERKVWEKKLSSLRKGQCIVSGPTLDSEGLLNYNSPVVINITSLIERDK